MPIPSSLPPLVSVKSDDLFEADVHLDRAYSALYLLVRAFEGEGDFGTAVSREGVFWLLWPSVLELQQGIEALRAALPREGGSAPAVRLRQAA